MTSGMPRPAARKYVALVCPSVVHSRNKLTLPDRGVERSEVFINNGPLRVDQESLRRTVNAPIDADATIFVISRCQVRIAKLVEPPDGFWTRVPPVNSVDRNSPAFSEVQQETMLCTAHDAPGGPHVDERVIARHVFRTDANF